MFQENYGKNEDPGASTIFVQISKVLSLGGTNDLQKSFFPENQNFLAIKLN